MRYTAVSWIGKTGEGAHRGVYIVDNAMGLYANSNGTWFKIHLNLLNAGDTSMREALNWSLHNRSMLILWH